jgi:hypothetical protein
MIPKVVCQYPDNSVIVTLDEQGRLVFPEGKVFAPDESVRLNKQ